MLRGASAAARAELVGRLAPARAPRTLADQATLGEQLLAVAGVLRSEPALRRITPMPRSRPRPRRGSLSAPCSPARSPTRRSTCSRKPCGSAGPARTTSPTCSRASASQPLVRSAGAKGATISDELFAVGQLIDDNHDLRGALSDPARSTDDKAALLSGIIGGRSNRPPSASSRRPSASRCPSGGR